MDKNSDMQIYSVVPYVPTSDKLTKENNVALFAKAVIKPKESLKSTLYKIKGDYYYQHFMIFEIQKL